METAEIFESDLKTVSEGEKRKESEKKQKLTSECAGASNLWIGALAYF